MNILITGGSCLLGKYLTDSVPLNWRVAATWYTNYVDLGVPMLQMDVGNKSQVSYVFARTQPDVVIHCAAVGSVNWVEAHYTEAAQVIVEGTRNVLDACRDHGALVVYTSTNAVFAGDRPPYKEDDPRKPVNAYGSLRRQAEDLVMNSLHWLNLRLFLLYGWPPPGARSNWAVTVRDKLKAGRRLNLVNDAYWQPTYAGDVAAAIWSLVAGGKDNEVYHVAGAERVTLYELGQAVAATWGLDGELLEPVGHDAFPTIAPRPVDSSYTLDKLYAASIKPRGVLDGLKAMKGEALW
jgi:dTDP-4-dehydrorhamnose reductase